MGLFNRVEAVRYALKWALGRNPAFPDYSSDHGSGGDCTNFVSQVMLAGGWPMRLGLSWHRASWWSYDSTASRTWASANRFSMYLEATPRTRQCEMRDLLPGDIVQMQVPQSDRPEHTMVVTSRTPGSGPDRIDLTYHSIDTYQRSLQDIQAHYPRDTQYFYWRVLDLFPDPDAELRRQIEQRGHIGNKI